MGVISFGIRIVAPADSPRGKKLRDSVARIRRRRAVLFAKARYNAGRKKYYRHAVTKQPANQEAKISIIVPCYNTPAKYFEPLLASVFAEGYGNWELVLVDASDNKARSDGIERRAKADDRIVYIKTANEGIAGNTNKGLARASGELIAFLDHDDTLDPDALANTAGLFASRPELGLVYSDEDKISDDGDLYFEPHFKPDFSLDMLRNVNYITHFVVVKKSIADKLKGIRSGFDGAQDYDFLLRVIDTGTEVGHVPKILYHWRQAEGSTAADFSNKRHVTDAGCRALRDHYARRGIKRVEVKAIENRPGFYRAVYDLDGTVRRIFVDLEKTALTVPERRYIADCYRRNRDVRKHKIQVVESKPPADAGAHDMIVRGPFIPAKDSADIASLFGLAQEDGVAGVAPKIVCGGKVFDAGFVKINGARRPLFKGLSPNRPLAFGSLEWVRNVDALSGNAGVYSKAKNGRFVIWSHSEFIALSAAADPASGPAGFYNPNLAEQTEIIEEPREYIADLIEVEK
jgi:glycosyltransferase involved in cell wall biosynthesis